MDKELLDKLELLSVLTIDELWKDRYEIYVGTMRDLEEDPMPFEEWKEIMKDYSFNSD